ESTVWPDYAGLRRRTSWRRRCPAGIPPARSGTAGTGKTGRAGGCRDRTRSRTRPDVESAGVWGKKTRGGHRPQLRSSANVPPTSPIVPRGAPCRALRRGNGQALAPFCAASLENQAAVFRSHPGQEAMSAPAPAAIRLKRAFTLHNDRYPCETELCPEKT